MTKRTIHKWVRAIREEFNRRTRLDRKRAPPVHLTTRFCDEQHYKGMDIEELKVLMGHGNVKTTEIYGRMQLDFEMREKYEKAV